VGVAGAADCANAATAMMHTAMNNTMTRFIMASLSLS
jgi:hypothetical protein